MVVTERSNPLENYEDLKRPLPPKLGSENQERTEHRKKLLRKILGTAKFLPSFSYYALECLVATIVIVCAVLLLLPMLVVYNALKFIERKWISFHTGAAATAMSGQDALWLQDDEKNRLIINSNMVVGASNVQTLLAGVRASVNRCIAMKNDLGEIAFPRLTRCIRKVTFQYILEEAKNFDIARHIYEYEGESPRSHEEMQEILSQLSSEDLTFEIPPWRFILIRKAYEENEVIVLFRGHHGLADGISLTKFISLIFPDPDNAERKLIKFSNVDRALMNVKALLVGARIILRKIFSTPDRSILHGRELSGLKKVAWSEYIDIKLIKRIKNSTGTTVNDVMMACISMSFHDYFKSKGITNPPDITASIPVDVRVPNYKVELENDFSIVSLKLPVSEKTIHKQLYTTKARMDEIKHSGEAFVMGTSANLTVQFMPECITKLWNKPIANMHSLVLSNVPGLTTPIIVAGHEVKSIFFWPPHRDLVGIGIGIYSYAGKVSIGVEGDVNCLPNPQLIVNAFKSNLAQLEASISKTGQTEVDSGIELH